MKEEFINILDQGIKLLKTRISLRDLEDEYAKSAEFISGLSQMEIMRKETELYNLMVEMQSEQRSLASLDIFDAKEEIPFRDLSSKLRKDLRRFRMLSDDISYQRNYIRKEKEENATLSERVNLKRKYFNKQMLSLVKLLNKLDNGEEKESSIVIFDFLSKLIYDVMDHMGPFILIVMDNLIDVLKRDLSREELFEYLDYLISLKNLLNVNLKVLEEINRESFDKDQRIIIGDYLSLLNSVLETMLDGSLVPEELGNKCNYYFENSLYVIGVNDDYADYELNLTLLYGPKESSNLSLKREKQEKVN